MGGKQPSVSAIQTPHSLGLTPDFFAPILVAIFWVPMSLLFGLGIQGEASAYVVSLISFGLLTSLDLRTGSVRAALGFIVSLLALSYAFGNSVIGQGLSPLVFGYWSLLLVALPPSLGVVMSTVLFSHRTHYKIPKANLLASLTTGIGLGIGSVMRAGASPSFESIMFSSAIFILLGLAANSIQTVLLHFLDKFWEARKFSLAMMPTAFFSYNSMIGFTYFASGNVNQAYTFFSSLGFLPALALTGIGAYGLAEKVLKGPSRGPGIRPTVTVTGDHLVRQGHMQVIKVATESGGQPKDMATISATILTPKGKRESLRLSRVSVGKYNASYQPGKPGNYTAQITVTSKQHSTSQESLSFTVQAPPAPHQPAQPPPRAPTPPQIRPPQPPSPPPQRPAVPVVTSGLPRLDSWDPKVWVNQEVHGYTIKEHLATGATGYVLRATFGQAGTEMALKIPILRTGTGTSALEETMSEATRLLELSGQSKYVVQLRGILVDRLNVQEIVKGDTALYLKSPPAIIMEFMKGGTAKRLLEDSSYDSLYYSERWGGIVMLVGYMIATALETIHNAGFVHLDVKPQNILFNAKPPVTGQEMMDQLLSGGLVPKLADLGSAVRTGGKVIQFTSEYAPAEQILGSGAGPSMDIYALGAMIYNMLTKTPANSKKLIDTMNNLISNPGSGRAMNDLKSTWDSYAPDFTKIDPKFAPATSVMKEMLAKDPRHRPQAGAVANSLQNLGSKHGLFRSQG